MAGFCLQLTSATPEEPTPQMRAAHGVMEKRGLEQSLDLSRPGFQLRYYHKILNPVAQVAENGGGDFAMACGTLIYGDAYGEVALAALLRDFDPSWSCLTRASGQFALVVYKHGELHLSTDHGGQFHIHRCAGSDFYSSSFLATCKAAPSTTPNVMNLHERLVCGAIHGDETFIDEVDRQSFREAWQLLPERRSLPKPPLPPIPQDLGGWDTALERCAKTFYEVLEPLVKIWGDQMATALTGGYDSRLLAAGLGAVGGSPAYLVYGPDSDPDVVIAKSICRAHGWSIDHLDKSRHPDPPLDQFEELVMRSFYFHDGRGIYGVFDNGTDLESRWHRARGGQLFLTGSVGGMFRDLVDIGRRRCTVDQMVRARYERHGSDWFHAESSFDRLMDQAADRIAALFDPPTRRLENWQIHALIPRWFSRYWMTPDNQNNNLLSPTLVPYTDPRLTELALALPQNWRDDGVFEADLIRTISPELAAHMSGYGWRFDQKPPLKVKLRRRFKHALPAALRHRWQRRARGRQQSRESLPGWLGPRYQDAALGSGPLLMDEFVRVDAIRSTNARNIVLSLELLLRNLS